MAYFKGLVFRSLLYFTFRHRWDGSGTVWKKGGKKVQELPWPWWEATAVSSEGPPRRQRQGNARRKPFRGGIEGLWSLSESEDSVENGVSRMTPTRFWPVQPGGWGAGPLPGQETWRGGGQHYSRKALLLLELSMWDCGLSAYFTILPRVLYRR